MMVGLFLGALDQTVVITALRSISDQLHGLSMQAWVTTAYLITSTISMALYGKLSDIYGRKKLYMAGIAIFMVGSAVSTFSQSIWQLAVFRAIQGVGAGGLMSLPSVILSDVVSPRERGRYAGYVLSVFGVASVVGPLIGGAFASAGSLLGLAGWRWIFLINIPLTLIALLIVAKVLNTPHDRVNRRVDYGGAVALIIGVVPILLVGEQGNTWGWTSARSVICYVTAVVGVAVFLAVQARMGRDGLIPLRLFRIGVFNVSNVLNVIFGFGSFGAFVLPPLYLQIVLGESPTVAGFFLVPWMVSAILGSIVTGRVTLKFGKYKLVTLIGFGMVAVTVFMFATVGPDTPAISPILIMTGMGFGFGLARAPLVLAVQNVVPPEEVGVATGCMRFFQQIGGTLGTAALLSVLFGLVAEKAATAYGAVMNTTSFSRLLTDPTVLANPDNRNFVHTLTHGGVAALNLNDTSYLARLNPQLARPLLVGFSGAVDAAFLICGILMAIGFVLAFWLKEVPLSRMAGVQQRAAAKKESASDSAPADDTVAAQRATTNSDAGATTSEAGG